jgi:hypothetical protein
MKKSFIAVNKIGNVVFVDKELEAVTTALRHVEAVRLILSNGTLSLGACTPQQAKDIFNSSRAYLRDALAVLNRIDF